MAQSQAARFNKEEFEEVDFRNGARGVFTFAETFEDEILPVSYEILRPARKMADKLGTNITTILIGENVKDKAMELIYRGADRVIVIEDPRLKEYRTIPYTKAIIQVIEKERPEVFLFGATTIGRDLAPRIAARLEVGLSADCTDFDVGEYYNRKKKQYFKNVAFFIRPSFEEAKLATIVGPWAFPQMATARPGVNEPFPRDPSRTGKIVEFKVELEESDFEVEILETVKDIQETVDFDSADVIVSGGLGVGKDGFKLLKELVNAINENGQAAVLGASRAAVDAGFISKKHQIGQTGRTVRPGLYLAFGISGAIQHVEGMKHSKVVVSVNTDHDAKIFQVSNIGIVDDYKNIVPVLIKKVKEGYRFPDFKKKKESE